MNNQNIVYDICRYYVRDNESYLSESLYKKLTGFIRARDYKRLAAASDLVAPDVASCDEWRILLQVSAFFKKNDMFTEPVLAKLAAFTSFLEAEQACLATNERIDSFSLERHEDVDLKVWIVRAQRYISHVLGDFAQFRREIPSEMRVTSGATATRSRRRSLPHLKLRRRMVSSQGAVKYIQALADSFGYGEMHHTVTSENRVEFVPKSWKTFRTIACEPDGCMPFQLAFDGYVKKRLRKVGIDLSSQVRNQKLAQRSSVDGTLSTIDLSAASDTLAYNTVVLLFPEEWFRYLRDFRSSYGRVSESLRVEFAKFSSMGNGATFTVETLVFAACCNAVGSKEYSVYGDDIIIETGLTDDLIKLLNFLGFTVNQEKSFTSGPFRESCGVNCYRGVDITPGYITGWDKRKATMCHMINTVMRVSEPFGELWKYLAQFVLEQKLPFVPYNYSSQSGVWIHPYHAYAKKLIKLKYQVPKFRGYIPVVEERITRSERTYFLWHLASLHSGGKNAWDRNATLTWVEILKGRRPKKTVAQEWAEEFSGMQPFGESSRYSISSHKYRRKWVHWIPPVAGAPDHLYWWSDFLIPND